MTLLPGIPLLKIVVFCVETTGCGTLFALPLSNLQRKMIWSSTRILIFGITRTAMYKDLTSLVPYGVQYLINFTWSLEAGHSEISSRLFLTPIREEGVG